MTKFYTQCRVQPLRSSDENSGKFSLKKSVAHDTRQYEENHIDNSLTKNNIITNDFSLKNFKEKIEKIKSEFGCVAKDTTIDVANYIFTVNKNFFDTQEKKQIFFDEVKNFMMQENGNFLGVVGHDDEDGFHVHAYAVPLCKTKFKNRYGEKEKIKINYRGKYSHTKEEISEYRKQKKNSELKTGKLQDRWALHIQKKFPELLRGEKSTGKINLKPAEYRELINREIPELQSEVDKMFSQRDMLEKSIENLDKKITENNKILQSKIEEKNSLENEKNRLENEIKMDTKIMKTLEEDIEIMSEKIKQKSDEISIKDLREIPVDIIAKKCGCNSYPSYVENNGKKERIDNAFDYLMYVQKMTYNGAVKYLTENFSAEAVANAIKNDEKTENEEPHYNLVKKEIIEKQFKALGYPIVRITVSKTEGFDANGKPIKKSIRIGKKPNEEIEEFYNVNQVKNMVDVLNKYNANGYNIYITPIEYNENSKQNFHILIDDVKNPEKIIEKIGNPALTIESSPENFQMIYNVKNLIDYTKEPDLAARLRAEAARKTSGKKYKYKLTDKLNKKIYETYNEIFRRLNHNFFSNDGDDLISGLRHPFRLCGFTNQKPNRDNDFFVKIHGKINPSENDKILKLIEDTLNSSEKEDEISQNFSPKM